MNTIQTPISLDLDSVLDRYFDPEQTLHRLAGQLGISLHSLAEFLDQAHVRQAIRRIQQMFRRRTPHLIVASLERNLRLMDSVAKIPENPTPADRDRLRREIETSRRVADLYRKMTPPPPTPKQPSQRSAAASPRPTIAATRSPNPIPSDPSSVLPHAATATPARPAAGHATPPPYQDRSPSSTHTGALAPAA